MSYGSYQEHETNWFQRNGYELFVVGAGLLGLIIGLVVGGVLGSKFFCHCPKASAPAMAVAARVTGTSTPTLTRTATGTAALTATATATSKVTATSVVRSTETPTIVKPTASPSSTKPIPTKTTAVEKPWAKNPEAKSGRYWVSYFDWLLYKEDGVIVLTGYFVPSDDNGKRRDDLKVRQTVWLKLHSTGGSCIVKLESVYDFLTQHIEEELEVDYAFGEILITAGEDQWSCMQKVY